MKKIVLISIAACLSLCSCGLNRDVDEMIETERYTLHIESFDVHGGTSYYMTTDSIVCHNTIPQLAYFLASSSHNPIIDNTTMYYINLKKQSFLPDYIHTIINHDTTQSLDYTPLLNAMMGKGVLRADTTYEPLRILELYDSTRYVANVEENDILNVLSIVTQLQEHYRMPISLAPGIDPNLLTKDYWMTDNWETDSLWLNSRGLRIVPDQQGRKMRIIEFNRCKGKI